MKKLYAVTIMVLLAAYAAFGAGPTHGTAGSGVEFPAIGGPGVTGPEYLTIGDIDNYVLQNMFLGTSSQLTAGNGALITLGTNLSITGGVLNATGGSGGSGTTTNSVTFNNSGSGASSGATFNGSAAPTISYNTVGALGASQEAVNSAQLNGTSGATVVAGAAAGATALQPTGNGSSLIGITASQVGAYPSSNPSNFITSSGAPVQTVFGRTGAVTAQSGDYSLSLLSGVLIETPVTNQFLTYNGTNWVNTTGVTLAQYAAYSTAQSNKTIPTGTIAAGSTSTFPSGATVYNYAQPLNVWLTDISSLSSVANLLNFAGLANPSVTSNLQMTSGGVLQWGTSSGGGGGGGAGRLPYGGVLTSTASIQNGYIYNLGGGSGTIYTFRSYSGGMQTPIFANTSTTICPDSVSGVISWVNPTNNVASTASAGYCVVVPKNTNLTVLSTGLSDNYQVVQTTRNLVQSTLSLGNADPYWTDVALLLHGNGTNGSSTITDSSFHAWTMTGSVNGMISTTHQKYGTGSIYFGSSPGTSNWISTPTESSFALGTNDFTVETWAYPISTSGNGGQIIDFRGGIEAVTAFGLGLNGTTGTLCLWNAGTSTLTTSSTVIASGAWSHIALVRHSGNVTLYINGVADSTFNNVSITTSFQAPLSGLGLLIGASIGASDSSVLYTWPGYLSDFRITNGAARYTSNFTPPSAQLPN